MRNDTGFWKVGMGMGNGIWNGNGIVIEDVDMLVMETENGIC